MFRVALDKAKRQFNLKRVILVADQGMASDPTSTLCVCPVLFAQRKALYVGKA